jgi:hypothetical protein
MRPELEAIEQEAYEAEKELRDPLDALKAENVRRQKLLDEGGLLGALQILKERERRHHISPEGDAS